jgi:hypothetical protein
LEAAVTAETFDITVSLPKELAEIFESPDEAAAFAHRSLVLELLRDAHISQGTAARLLGITRWEIIDLMGKHHIPSGPATPEELAQELEAIDRYLEKHPARARS